MLAAQQMPAAPQPAAPTANWRDRLTGWLTGNDLSRRPHAHRRAGRPAFRSDSRHVHVRHTRCVGTALPGDVLYPVKTTVEDLRLTLMRGAAQRDSVHPAARDALRRVEARTVADTGREVRRLALQGELEAIRDDRWIVSGLEVLITPDTQIIGTPALGASVNGTMTAPGDYTLVGVYLEVEPPVGSAGAPPTRTATPTPTPSPTATRCAAHRHTDRHLTRHPTRPHTTCLRARSRSADAVYHEPTDWPIGDRNLHPHTHLHTAADRHEHARAHGHTERDAHRLPHAPARTGQGPHYRLGDSESRVPGGR